MITFRQIEAFKALMEAGTVVKAAEVMGLSQPAVSRLVADLEAGIGYPLFDRRRGQLVALMEAKDLYAEVERAFIGLSSIVDAADRIGRHGRTRLRIAAIPGLCIGLLPKAVADLQRESPEILVSLEVRSRFQILEEIGAGRHDLGFAGSPLDAPNVHARTIARPDCVCVVPPQHPLADHKTIRAEDFDGVSLVVAADRTPIARLVNRRLRKAGVRPIVRAEVTSAHSAFALAAAGVGMVLVPRPFLFGYPLGDLRLIEFKPRFEFELGLYHPADQALEGAAARFVALFIEALEGFSPRGRGDVVDALPKIRSRVG